MSARFYPNVLAVFGTNLAELKGGAHLAVELVLLLCDLDVVFRSRSDGPTQIRIDITSVWIQIAETGYPLFNHTFLFLLNRNIQIFSAAIEQRLTQRLVLRNGLEDGAILCDITYGPLT